METPGKWGSAPSVLGVQEPEQVFWADLGATLNGSEVGGICWIYERMFEEYPSYDELGDHALQYPVSVREPSTG